MYECGDFRTAFRWMLGDVTGATGFARPFSVEVTGPALHPLPQSDSFADFWARRWNLTVTYMMRTLIYAPAMEGTCRACVVACVGGC